jgi:hypothetical protein
VNSLQTRDEDGRLVTAGQVEAVRRWDPVRLRNQPAPGTVGGVTRCFAAGYYRHGGVLPHVLRTVTRAPGRRDGPGRPGPPPG